MDKTLRLCPPYEGSEPYLYLCFAEKDREAVFPLLDYLYLRGCRIWYSLETTADLEELKKQQERMNNASLLVIYLTENARNDERVKNSLLYYQNGKPVIGIDTDDGDNELAFGLTAAARHIDGRKGRAAEELEADLIRTEGFTQELIGDPKKRMSKALKALLVFAVIVALIGMAAATAAIGRQQFGWWPTPTLEPTPTPTPRPFDSREMAFIAATAEGVSSGAKEGVAFGFVMDGFFAAGGEIAAGAETYLRLSQYRGFGGCVGASAAQISAGWAETEELDLRSMPEDVTTLDCFPNLKRVRLPQSEAAGALEALEARGITLVLSPEGEGMP